MRLRIPRLLAPLLLIPALAGCPHGGPGSDGKAGGDAPAEATARRVAPPPDAPNVLLVTVDTLRADHVGAWGAGPGRTPTLDALAARGVVFEQAIAPAPLTLPSHASILTGLYPPTHGVRHNGIFQLDASVPRLPQRFREAGFATGAVVGAMVLHPRFGLGLGFDHYDVDHGGAVSAPGGYLHRTADRVTDAALAWLEDAPRPFFLWVHYFDPHGGYDPPPAWRARFPEDPYAGEIAFVDAELGRLLDALEARGERADTLAVVTADHGESLGEHGEPTHAYTVYDATQHVPWLIAGPGVPAGRRVPDVVSTADLAPTLLGLLGLPALPDTDGMDLGGRIAGGAGADAPAREGVYAETLAPRLDHGFAPLHALRSDAWLYVDAPRPELYALDDDPGQTHNLLAEQGARVPAPLEDGLARARGRERALEPELLDDATRRQLEALGYALPTHAIPPETGIDPKDGLPWIRAYERAHELYYAGRPVEAERLAAPLAEPLDSSPSLHRLLAMIYLSLEQPAQAEVHALRLQELAPESAAVPLLLGYARVARGDPAAAVEAFERAVALDPERAEAHAALMWRAAVDGDLEQAVRAAQRAFALEPRSPSVAILVGDNWERLGRPDRALPAYRRARELDPRNPAGHVGVASALARLGRGEEALQALAGAGPAARSVSARMRVAVGLGRGGDLPRAERVLRELVAERPQEAAPRRLLADLLEHRGRAEEARAVRRGGGAS